MGTSPTPMKKVIKREVNKTLLYRMMTEVIMREF